MLDEGRYASISEMAAAERIDRGYLGRVLRLTLTAPDIIAAILDGQQPEGLRLLKLTEASASAWLAYIAAAGLPTQPARLGGSSGRNSTIPTSSAGTAHAMNPTP